MFFFTNETKKLYQIRLSWSAIVRIFNTSYYLPHPSTCFHTFYEWGFFKISWLFWSQYIIVCVIAWFVVTFGINTTSDISKLLYVISRAVRRVKFETILKYHEQYLCQMSCTNHAILCLYYYPQKVWNFHT